MGFGSAGSVVMNSGADFISNRKNLAAIEDLVPKAQYSPKEVYDMVFWSKSLKV